MYFITSIDPVLQLFARGGGGGSGGGSGGGGIILVGYVPMHLLGAWIRHLHKKHEVLFDTIQVLGWLIAIIYSFVLVIAVHWIGLVMAIGAMTGMGAGLYGWFGKLRQSKKTKVELETAAKLDSTWDESSIITSAKNTFMRFQADWSRLDAEPMKVYLTPDYQYHNSLMLYALRLANRQNNVSNPVISQATITAVSDSTNNSQDTVTVGFEATANDQLINTSTNSQIFADNRPFVEYWQFKRNGQGWLLDGIRQTTASFDIYSVPLQQFASKNGYYFSLDWGWLLLPERGQLFSRGKFGTSDINNHVIGLYKKQLLIQLYNYIPKPKSSYNGYLIAQANLPRSYGDIVVRHKHALNFSGIHGLRKVSTEWPDFNHKYEVYATSPEQATSLELLNPKYMEQLEATPFEVNIEVVDNVVYLYSPENTNADPKKYQTMLDLLFAAFTEMKL
ncbi:MAG: TIM44-like domain-containing protein [Candidatus Saccharimonadales bacterium]